ncbi:Ig-like domain-containing protein [Herbidospora mongoliensis]|uniref:Ig-like domain-containing protein n=1 Tax=Herbidospora mongoliensis TaxID=688067 RepID=UPI000A674E50|nr:Ig-like domain-containing protein [Herbidospora mongoliensis]
MSDSWLDHGDFEALDLFGGGESAEDYLDDVDDDAESYDDEAVSPAVRRRRVKARQQAVRRQRLAALARVRNRRARAPSGPAPTAHNAVRQTQIAVRDLNLDSKVQADAMKSALQAQSKRITRSEYAALSSVALSQFQQSFPKIVGDNPYARAALSFAPLLFLSPAKQGNGAAAIAGDPRVIGAVLTAGLAIAGDRLRPKQVRQIVAPNVPRIVTGRQALLTADAQDENGKRIDGTVFTWGSSNDAVARVKPTGGQTIEVTGVSAGTAVITVTSAGVQHQIQIEVESAVREVAVHGYPIVVKGKPRMFIADALDDRGRRVDRAVFAWESSDTTVATVEPATGPKTEVIGVSAGAAFITASTDGVMHRWPVQVEAAAEIPVTPPVEALPTIAPDIREIVVSGVSKIAAKSVVKLIADALDNRGRRIDSAVFTWESSDTTIAKVDKATGKVTGVSAGTALITARSDGVLRRMPIEVQ